MQPIRVYDTHFFIGENRPFTEANERFGIHNHFGLKNTLDLLLRTKERYDAEGKYDLRFIIISASPESNYYIGDVVRDHPDAISGAMLQVVPKEGLLWPHTPVQELSELLEDDAIVGLKVIPPMVKAPIHPLSEGALNPYFELAVKHDKAFLVHCSSKGEEYTSPPAIDAVLRGYPGLRFIGAHMGGLDDLLIVSSIYFMVKYENFYVNTAGTSGEQKVYGLDNDALTVKSWVTNPELRNKFRQAVPLFINGHPGHILLGSDCPELTHDLNLDVLTKEQIAHTARATEKVFKLNS